MKFLTRGIITVLIIIMVWPLALGLLVKFGIHTSELSMYFIAFMASIVCGITVVLLYDKIVNSGNRLKGTNSMVGDENKAKSIIAICLFVVLALFEYIFLYFYYTIVIWYL